MKVKYSPTCRAVIAAVCLDFGANKETITETTERQIEGVFRPFTKDEKKSKIKRGGRKRPPLGYKAPQCGAFHN